MSDARLEHATLQQAADWFARLQGASDDAQLQAAWRDWLHASEQHRRAWHYIERVSQSFASLGAQGPAAHQTLLDQRRSKHGRRQVLGQLSVVGGIVLLGGLGWQQDWHQRLPLVGARYRSSNELRHERLADGSQIWLNARTALDIEFDGRQRRLRLYAGEVLIDTGSDPRPFQVQTRAGVLIPLGTRFSVRQQGGQTLLNVYAGAVQVRCANHGQHAVAAAGQSLSFDADTLGTPGSALAQREAWSKGLLLAEDMTLQQFIAELAPWRHGHLGVAPEVSQLRVMGSFSLRNTDQALAQLQEALPVQVVKRFDWWVTVEPR